MINLKTVPVPVKKIIIREMGEETILVSEKENLVHTLDEVGSVIWKNIDGKNNLSKILDAVCEEFDVDKKKAEKDLFVFINKLLDKVLISIK